MRTKILKIFFIFVFFICLRLYSQQQQDFYPLYITGSVPLNEYTLFANSGWDGNWYVGTNMCWIKKFKKEFLPDKDFFSKLYVGVKLGRSKTVPKPNSPPWEKEIIDGNIYIGISSTAAWKSDQRYFLCKFSDIPTEGDWENALATTGEARWFFTEVPLEKIDTNQDIYVCVYSNTPNILSASSAPILAAGWRERYQKESFVWLNNEINGSPPIDPSNSLKTQIRAFDAAIVLKFIPYGAENLPVKIKIAKITDGRPNTDEKVFYIKPMTPNIQTIWMEISSDKENYTKISKYQYDEPFVFNLNTNMIPKEINGDFYLRFVAKDIFENIGYSEELQLNIKREQKEIQTQQKIKK
ncbi:MAG: hypothetical protein ACK4WJ_02750 [Endomicrobiia bacterium]